MRRRQAILASDPVNVVFGDNGTDTINLASLPGVVASAPTFIYGLAGTDTISGAGMTGTLYFDAGTGNDTLTGYLKVDHTRLEYLNGRIERSEARTGYIRLRQLYLSVIYATIIAAFFVVLGV